MDNKSNLKSLIDVKFKIFKNNILIIFLILISGFLIYTLDGVFWAIGIFFFALLLFCVLFEELKQNIDSYNSIICKKLPINESNNSKNNSSGFKNTTISDKKFDNTKVYNKDLDNTTISNLEENNEVFPITETFTQLSFDENGYTESFYDEEQHYCDICGNLLTEEEYEMYLNYCEDCYSDINVDYQINGLTDYNKPFIDAIDDPDVYDDFFDLGNDDLYNEDLFSNDFFDDNFDEF